MTREHGVFLPNEWRAAGVSPPVLPNDWRAAGVSPPVLPNEWRAAGVSPPVLHMPDICARSAQYHLRWNQQTIGKMVAETRHRWADAHRSPDFCNVWVYRDTGPRLGEFPALRILLY